MKVRYFRRSQITFIVITAALLLPSCSIFYRKFYADPVKCMDDALLRKPFDVIIVPGYPFDTTGINPIPEQRIAWAAYLYKNGLAKHVIFSGAAVHSPYVEAKAMRLYALSAGIRDEDIFIEPTAEHTTENLYYSFLMAEKLGFKTKALASQPNQVSSMIHFIKKYKLNLHLLPILSDSAKKYPLPSKHLSISEAFVPGFISIKDRDGRLKNFTGTLGFKVRSEIRKARKLKNKEVGG